MLNARVEFASLGGFAHVIRRDGNEIVPPSNLSAVLGPA